MKKFKNSLVVALTTLTVATVGINVVPTLLGQGTVVAEAATSATFRKVSFNDSSPESREFIDVVPGHEYTFTFTADRSDVGTLGALDFRVYGDNVNGGEFGTVHFDGNKKGTNTATITVKIPKEYTGNTVTVSRTYSQAVGDGTESTTAQVWGPQTVTTTDVTPVSTGNVEVHYVEVDEAQQPVKELQAATTITGNVGEDYKTEGPATITIGNDVYDLIGDTGNTTGKYTAETTQVAYVYQLRKTVAPVGQGTVTAKYVDEKGNKLADDKTLTGKVGEAYKTEAPQTITKDKKEYVLTATPKNAEGTYAADPATVTYVYKEKAAAVVTDPAKKDPAKKVEKTLPKTGDTNSILPTILGSLVLVASAVVVFFKKKKA